MRESEPSTERERAPSSKEADLFDLSVNKVKGGEHSFSKESSSPVSYVDLHEDPNEVLGGKSKSYLDSVLGRNGGEGDSDEGMKDSHKATHEGDKENEVEKHNITIVKKKLEGYDCLKFILTEK